MGPLRLWRPDAASVPTGRVCSLTNPPRKALQRPPAMAAARPMAITDADPPVAAGPGTAGGGRGIGEFGAS